MFKEERNHTIFKWEDLGNTKTGRPNLGEQVPVLVYRLFQYTMRDVLNSNYDVETANQLLVEAGKSAGQQFCQNVLDTNLKFNEFLSELQKILKELKIGILRLERINQETGEMILTVAEDLDCSGLPPTDETVCDYDEGFIAGIFKEYTGRDYVAKEIDCWANGDRVCRFNAKPC